MIRQVLSSLFVVVAVGCSGSSDITSGRDGGAEGSPDASMVQDATASDASGPDAEARDSGAVDGGPADAGSSDSGSDAGDMAEGNDAGLPDGPSSERLTRVPVDSIGNPSGFWEYLPPGFGDGAARPLLVFWHGVGENGNGDSDLGKVLRNGPPRLQDRDQWPSDRDFVVLSPQHPGAGCPSSSEIDAFYTWAISHYGDALDPTKIYLTGLSCGAIGSWNYLSNHTDGPVAAAVLIAGDGRGAWNRAGCDLGKFAIWGFHGDADSTVSPQGTNVPIDNLIADCPNRIEARKTIYPGVGHNSWGRTYDLSAGHDIYDWLDGYSR